MIKVWVLYRLHNIGMILLSEEPEERSSEEFWCNIAITALKEPHWSHVLLNLIIFYNVCKWDLFLTKVALPILLPFLFIVVVRL